MVCHWNEHDEGAVTLPRQRPLPARREEEKFPPPPSSGGGFAPGQNGAPVSGDNDEVPLDGHQ